MSLVRASLVLALVATAARAAPLPPPPGGDHAGAVRRAARLVDHAYGRAQDPGFCVLAEPTTEAALATIGPLVGDAADGAPLVAYVDRYLRPYLAAQRVGVPGLGSYAVLASRREAGRRWLLAHLPPAAPLDDDAAIARYADAEAALLARVAAERAWIATVLAASPCLRQVARRRELAPALAGFAAYQDWLAEPSIAALLAPVRAAAWPRVEAHVAAAAALAEVRAARFATPGELGDALLAVARAVVAIDADDEVAARLARLGARLPAPPPIIAATLAERAAVRAALVAWFDANLLRMAPPPAVADGPAAAQVSAWTRRGGHAVIARRVTAALVPFDARVRELGGRTYHPAVRIRGSRYGFHVIHSGAPWDAAWPADLGAHAPLCTLEGIVAVRYDVGVALHLGVWTYQRTPRYPIRCDAHDRTFDEGR